MPLPEKIRVKLSSEAAGAISLTPVVVQELAIDELLAAVLAVTGMNPARIQEVLKRGGLVSGATRYRWEPLTVEAADLEQALTKFPVSDASIAFNAAQCGHAVLRHQTHAIQIPREAAAKTRFLKRQSFWQALIDEARQPQYVEYSYKERADIFHCELNFEAVERLRAAASLLTYSALEAQIKTGDFRIVELRVAR